MSDHSVPVVRISEIKVHPNADKLEIIPILGFQCVVGKGQFKIGDLAVYVPPDSIVPDRKEFSFVWGRDGGGQPRVIVPEMPIPEKWRRITVRKLRKEYSEGLLMPMADFPGIALSFEGEDVAELLNITHYNPPEPEESTPPSSKKQSKVWPRSLKGWMYFLSYWLSFGLYNPWGSTHGFGNEKAPKNTPPVYDVENLKRFANVFAEGEQVIVTEKIHGCNARYQFQGDHMYAGSRQMWKSKNSTTIWRKVLEINPMIEKWCRDFPNYTLYGEAVPCQKSRKGFEYTYGADRTNPKLFLFDVRDPEGKWVEYEAAIKMTDGYDLVWAPLLYSGPYGPNVAMMSEGPTQTFDRHIREGCVIQSVPERHVHGLGRAQLKIVSNVFLESEKE